MKANLCFVISTCVTQRKTKEKTKSSPFSAQYVILGFEEITTNQTRYEYILDIDEAATKFLKGQYYCVYVTHKEKVQQGNISDLDSDVVDCMSKHYNVIAVEDLKYWTFKYAFNITTNYLVIGVHMLLFLHAWIDIIIHPQPFKHEALQPRIKCLNPTNDISLSATDSLDFGLLFQHAPLGKPFSSELCMHLDAQKEVKWPINATFFCKMQNIEINNMCFSHYENHRLIALSGLIEKIFLHFVTPNISPWQSFFSLTNFTKFRCTLTASWIQFTSPSGHETLVKRSFAGGQTTQHYQRTDLHFFSFCAKHHCQIRSFSWDLTRKFCTNKEASLPEILDKEDLKTIIDAVKSSKHSIVRTGIFLGLRRSR